jgi:hypothetical protein
VRSFNEHYLVMRRFFDGLPADLFREAFADDLVHRDFADGLEYACEQAFLYCGSSFPLNRLIGIDRLHALLNDPAGAAVLARRYNFPTARFFDLLRTVNVTDLFAGQETTVSSDSGAGADLDWRVTRRANQTVRDFSLTFPLDPDPARRTLRWAPAETRRCRVRIDVIRQRDEAGHEHLVELSTVQSNGKRLEDDSVLFDTLDPSFSWPTEPGAAGATVEGQWECEPLAETARRLEQEVVNLRQTLSAARHQLRCREAELRNREDQIRARDQELRSVYASRSWRWAGPMRRASRLVKRLKAG